MIPNINFSTLLGVGMGFKKRARANRPPKPKKAKSCLCMSKKNTKMKNQCCLPPQPERKSFTEKPA